MKAALLVAPGRIAVGEFPDPELGPDDVRIAVGGVGLCGSDASVFSGRWSTPTLPWIMGHEACGTIEAVGQRVSGARIGEAVVVEPNVVCFECDQCLQGRTSACLRRQSVGMNRQGALAERLVVPSRFAWPVERVAPVDLVCVEPLTVVEAALRRLGAPPPDPVLVIGCGPQGLLMCHALLRRGIGMEVHDINAGRVAFAAELGARPLDTEATERRFHLVVDTVGAPSSVEMALSRLEIGGTLLVLGLDGTPFELTAQRLVRRQLVLRGSLTYDHPDDFQRTVAAVRAGGLLPGRIVTDEYSLDDAQLAFERGADTRGKTWIRVR